MQRAQIGGMLEHVCLELQESKFSSVMTSTCRAQRSPSSTQIKINSDYSQVWNQLRSYQFSSEQAKHNQPFSSSCRFSTGKMSVTPPREYTLLCSLKSSVYIEFSKGRDSVRRYVRDRTQYDTRAQPCPSILRPAPTPRQRV